MERVTSLAGVSRRATDFEARRSSTLPWLELKDSLG